MVQIGKSGNESDAMFQLRQLSLPSPLTNPPPPNNNNKKKKENPSLYAWEPPGRHFILSFTHTRLHRERGKENLSATSVFPFSSTVMNRELCKQQSNLRTGKLDGQSGGPVSFA